MYVGSRPDEQRPSISWLIRAWVIVTLIYSSAPQIVFFFQNRTLDFSFIYILARLSEWQNKG